MEEVNYTRVDYLIKRCMQQQETADERTELETYSQLPTYQIYIQRALLAAFYMDKPLTDISDTQQQQILTAISQLNTKIIRKTRLRRLLPWMAAAAVVLFFLLMPYIHKIPIDDQLTSTTPEKIDWSSADTGLYAKPLNNDPQPAKEKAMLILTDGFRVNLAALKEGQHVERAGLKIEKLAEGNLSILFEDRLTSLEESKMNSISTPKGGIYVVKFGDGTKVHLNASSTLKFPSRFATDQRDVYLEGEGYFEVSKDRLRRFVVHSRNGDRQQQVMVYGTEFNVMAYPEKQYFVTTLIEGSVKIKDGNNGDESFLLPNQQAILNTGQLHISKADLTANLAWKNKLFYFADERLADVMLEISRWYNVDIKYQGSVPKLRIWGQISRDKTLTEVLNILAETNDIQFDVKGKEVAVRMK